jgi:hypothetical protein
VLKVLANREQAGQGNNADEQFGDCACLNQHLASDDKKHHLDQAFGRSADKHNRQLNADHKQQDVLQQIFEDPVQAVTADKFVEMGDLSGQKDDAKDHKYQAKGGQAHLEPV